MIDHLTTAVLVLGRGPVIERMNPAAEALLETSIQAARGAPLSGLVAAGELLDAVDRVLDTAEPLTERALPVTLDTGRTRVVDCTLTPVAATRGAPKVLVELARLDRHHQIAREERQLAELQTRLLRVLADGEFYRVGGHVPVCVDVRIVAATHQDLEARVRDGTFREDLFHRLNVIRVHSPALRERREDVPLLLAHCLERAAAEIAVEPKTLRPEVTRYLETLDWPGNVRQLENACRWLTVMASGKEIHLEDLPPELRGGGDGDDAGDWEAPLRRWAERRIALGHRTLLDDAMPRFETVLIRCALGHTGGRRQEAARLLGWGRNTLTRRIKELALDV